MTGQIRGGYTSGQAGMAAGCGCMAIAFGLGVMAGIVLALLLVRA